MIKRLWKRLFCRHKCGWRVVHIAFDGVTIVKCPECGKIKKIPLPR